MEGVVERPKVGVDLFREIAGQKPEALARLDRGTRQDDALDLPLLRARTAIAIAR